MLAARGSLKRLQSLPVRTIATSTVCAVTAVRALRTSTAACEAPAVLHDLPTTPAGLASLPRASPVSVVLYQYNSCPFCNKVRAYLDYAKVPYTVVEVDPLIKSQISWSKGYRKVPIAVINGKQVNDSNAIIDAVDAELKAYLREVTAAKMATTTPIPAGSGSVDEAKWRAWVDSHLVHVFTSNIYRTPGEALRSFDYMTERNFPVWSAVPAKYIGASIMYLIGKKNMKKHGLGDDPRAALYAAADTWTSAIAAKGASHGPFMGGQRPDLSDLAVFGVLRAIAGLDTAKDLAQHGGITAWYTAMTKEVGQTSLVHRVMEPPVQ